MKPQALKDWAIAEPRKGAVSLKVDGTPPPRLRERLLHLDGLGLPLDEVFMSLVAQAPIDPIGVFGAIRKHGRWAFQSPDCTVVNVLAQEGDRVLAAMRLDLLSDDLAFLAFRGERLEVIDVILGDTFAQWLREPDISEDVIMERIKACAKRALVISISKAPRRLVSRRRGSR